MCVLSEEKIDRLVEHGIPVSHLTSFTHAGERVFLSLHSIKFTLCVCSILCYSRHGYMLLFSNWVDPVCVTFLKG